MGNVTQEQINQLIATIISWDNVYESRSGEKLITALDELLLDSERLDALGDAHFFYGVSHVGPDDRYKVWRSVVKDDDGPKSYKDIRDAADDVIRMNLEDKVVQNEL